MDQMKTGAIISPVRFLSPGSQLIGLDDQMLPKLKQALLYWDRVCAPTILGPAFAPVYWQELQFLASLDAVTTFEVASRPQWSHHEAQRDVPKMVDSFKKIESRNGESWGYLVDPGWYSVGVDRKSGETSAAVIEVTLFGALPVPTREVSYEDILSFRQQRSDELQRLHIEIGNIAGVAAAYSEESEPMNRALREVNNAVADIQKVYDERWGESVFTSLRNAFVSDFLLPTAALYAVGVPLSLAGTVQAGVATVKVAASNWDARSKLEPSLRPYVYAVEAQRI